MARIERLQVAVKETICLIIHDELKDPRVGFITITKVEMSKDLRMAKVFYSVLGGEAEYQKTKEALDSAMGFIRKLVGERVRLKFTPEIMFKVDKSAEYSIRIQKVIDEIKDLEPAKDGDSALEAIPELKKKDSKPVKKTTKKSSSPGSEE